MQQRVITCGMTGLALKYVMWRLAINAYPVMNCLKALKAPISCRLLPYSIPESANTRILQMANMVSRYGLSAPNELLYLSFRLLPTKHGLIRLRPVLWRHQSSWPVSASLAAENCLMAPSWFPWLRP